MVRKNNGLRVLTVFLAILIMFSLCNIGIKSANATTSADLSISQNGIDFILSESKISDANLRMLVKQIYVHQNEDKSLDVRFEFNGDFEDNYTVYTKEESE